MATKEEILDAIANMSVLELSELLKDFEEKFGVTAAAPVAVAAAPAAGGAAGGEAAAEEKDEFDVILTGAGDKKIQVIKEVRSLTEPGSQGSQGPRGRRSQARARGRVQGRGREGQGRPRGCWRLRRGRVARTAAPAARRRTERRRARPPGRALPRAASAFRRPMLDRRGPFLYRAAQSFRGRSG